MAETIYLFEDVTLEGVVVKANEFIAGLAGGENYLANQLVIRESVPRHVMTVTTSGKPTNPYRKAMPGYEEA
jgi:hypothetical protein